MRAGSVALHASCGTAAQNFIPSRISLTIIVVNSTQSGHSLLIPLLLTLPETSNLPIVFRFAECIPSETRRTSSLPSAALKTLGKKKTLSKEEVCRV